MHPFSLKLVQPNMAHSSTLYTTISQCSGPYTVGGYRLGVYMQANTPSVRASESPAALLILQTILGLVCLKTARLREKACNILEMLNSK